MGTNGNTIRNELIEKGCSFELLDLLLDQWFDADRESAHGRRLRELDWIKRQLKAHIRCLESHATHIEQLDARQLHHFSDMPLALVAPKNFFPTQAASIRSVSASLRQFASDLARCLNLRDKKARPIQVLYLYCKEVTQNDITHQNVADLLNWKTEFERSRLNSVPDLAARIWVGDDIKERMARLRLSRNKTLYQDLKRMARVFAFVTPKPSYRCKSPPAGRRRSQPTVAPKNCRS